jgi:hypothetical protein
LEAGVFSKESAMDRLLMLDKQEYVRRMQEECRRVMEEVADAVNAAPSGNVVSGSEMAVRDLMAEFRRKSFETAVQMRIDSTESSFSPSAGRVGKRKGQQRVVRQKHAKRLRPDPDASSSVR